MVSPHFQPACQNAVQRSSSKLVTRFAWHSYAAALRRVLELTMASTRGHQEPNVVGKKAKHLADLHRTDYGVDRGEYSNRGLTIKVTGAQPLPFARMKTRTRASG